MAMAMDVSVAARRGLRRLHAAMEAFEAQLQCPICLCAYASPASLPCNHCFCEECIHRALELKAVCPICKAPAKKRSLRHDTMVQQLLQASELWASVELPLELQVRPEEDEDEKRRRAEATTTTTKTTTTPIRINPLIATAEPTVSAPSSEETVRRRKNDVVKQDAPIANGDKRSDEPMPQAPQETIYVDSDSSEDVEDESESEYEEEEEIEEKAPLPVPRIDEQPPAKKLRAIANGFTNGTTSDTKLTNGHHFNNANGTAHSEGTTFVAGQLVEVMNRTWRGINKPGGAAWITKVNENGTYDVKYIIGNGRESNVHDQYILTPSEEIGSLATPGRAVKQNRRKSTKQATPPSVDLLGGYKRTNGIVKSRKSDLVFLCSGYLEGDVDQIRIWASEMGAEIVDHWSPYVTHLIAKCATPKEVAASLEENDHYTGASSSGTVQNSRKRSLFKEDLHKRWVKIRSMKYLKALVGGRWIVSEEWLRDCVKQGKRLAEASYEADGHLKAQNVNAACQRSRAMREEILRSLPEDTNPHSVGTRLFADYCFHIYGEFLPPMPPPPELDMLISIGGGKTLHFLDEIAMEMDKPENRHRTLVIVSDKLNQQMLRRAAKELTALPQLQGIVDKHVVSYQWILNSISEAKLRAFS